MRIGTIEIDEDRHLDGRLGWQALVATPEVRAAELARR